MYDFEKLYEAYRKCRRGKMQKTEVIQFELNFSEKLVRLKQELETKTYHLGNYYDFTIYDPKKREIQALPFRNRIVQHNLCDNILEPLLEHYLVMTTAPVGREKAHIF